MIKIICQDFRPQRFKEVVGQDLAKELLKAIVKNPDNSPKSIILQGEYGTGKTTCARIFAKALNCKHSSLGDNCGECDFCKSNIENSIYYEEYDSAMIGNVSDIKEIKDTFYFDNSLGYKVIVLDEAHLMTPQAQSALLKVLEEANSNMFFILCTTNVDKILPTIRSRSLKIDFSLVDDNDIRSNIINIANQKNVSIDDYSLDLIISRSKGHLRDANILLDEYILLGEDKFKELIKSSKELYYKLIICALKNDLDKVKSIIYALQCFPLYILKNDYEEMVMNIIECSLKLKNPDNKFLQVIINYFNNSSFILINILNNKRIYEMFVSDKQFQSAMYIIVSNLINLNKR